MGNQQWSSSVPLNLHCSGKSLRYNCGEMKNPSQKEEAIRRIQETLHNQYKEFLEDQQLMAAIEVSLESAMKVLKANPQVNVIMVLPFNAAGEICGQPPFAEENPPGDLAIDPAQVGQARSAGAALPKDVALWTLVYTTVDLLDDAKPKSMMVAEGYRRGATRGISAGQHFERKLSQAGEMFPLGIIELQQ
jgi:hypothetical protein